MLSVDHVKRYLQDNKSPASVEELFHALKHHVSAEQAMKACMRTRRTWKMLELPEAIEVGQRAVVRDKIHGMIYHGTLVERGTGCGMDRIVQLPPWSMWHRDVRWGNELVSALTTTVHLFLDRNQWTYLCSRWRDDQPDLHDELWAVYHKIRYGRAQERKPESERQEGLVEEPEDMEFEDVFG